MTARKPFEPRPNSMERIATLEATVGRLEACVVELLVGLHGIGGSGVVARSPHARAVAYAYQQRSREREAA